MGSIHIEIDSLEGLNDRLEAMLDWETHSSVIREPGTGKIISYSPEKLLQPRLLGWSVVTSFGASILRSPTMLYHQHERPKDKGLSSWRHVVSYSGERPRQTFPLGCPACCNQAV